MNLWNTENKPSRRQGKIKKQREESKTDEQGGEAELAAGKFGRGVFTEPRPQAGEEPEETEECDGRQRHAEEPSAGEARPEAQDEEADGAASGEQIDQGYEAEIYAALG